MALFRRPSNWGRMEEMAVRLGTDVEGALDSQRLHPHELRYAATRCGECRSHDLCDPLFASPAEDGAFAAGSAPDFCPNRLLYDRLKRAAG